MILFCMNLTQPDLLIFNIYLNFKNILKIFLFTFLPLFLNKTQIFSSLLIICVDLVLYSELFGDKFALICSGSVLILNLMLIIVIKKKKSVQTMDPTRSTWVQLDPCDGLNWVKFL